MVGRLVAKLAADGRTFAEARIDELVEISALFDEGYYQIVALDRVLAGKISPGGTAPGSVNEQLKIARTVLARLEPTSE
jgi:argininosuccinate lyase